MTVVKMLEIVYPQKICACIVWYCHCICYFSSLSSQVGKLNFMGHALLLLPKYVLCENLTRKNLIIFHPNYLECKIQSGTSHGSYPRVTIIQKMVVLWLLSGSGYYVSYG